MTLQEKATSFLDFCVGCTIDIQVNKVCAELHKRAEAAKTTAQKIDFATQLGLIIDVLKENGEFPTLPGESK